MKELRKMENFIYNTRRAFERQSGEKYNFHGERRAFAQSRYKEYRAQGLSDKETRLRLSSELGHNRTNVAND